MFFLMQVISFCFLSFLAEQKIYAADHDAIVKSLSCFLDQSQFHEIFQEHREEIELCKWNLNHFENKDTEEYKSVVTHSHDLALLVTKKMLEESSDSKHSIDLINRFFPEVYYKLFGEYPDEFDYSLNSSFECENGVVENVVMHKKSKNYEQIIFFSVKKSSLGL